jgi:hypothetical protein
MKTTVFVAFIAALLQIYSVSGWSALTLANPMVDAARCGRGISGWVSSPDGLIDSGSLSAIQGHISSIFAGKEPYSRLHCPATGEDVPIELVAVVVRKVGGDHKRVMRFAKGIHRRLDVGTKGCGSGAVVVIAVEDRQVRLLTSESSMHMYCAAQ